MVDGVVNVLRYRSSVLARIFFDLRKSRAATPATHARWLSEAVERKSLDKHLDQTRILQEHYDDARVE